MLGNTTQQFFKRTVLYHQLSFNSKNTRIKKSINITSFIFTSLLEYKCFTTFCQFLLYNKVKQLYVYIYSHIPSLLSLPLTLPIPSLQVITKHQIDLLVLCSSFPLAINFTFGSVYMSMLLSHFIPAPPLHPVPSSPFSTSMSLFLPCHQVHQYCFFNSTYMHQHTVFIFLFLTYFTLYDRFQIHPPHYK